MKSKLFPMFSPASATALATISLSLLLPLSASATEFTWNGPVDGTWDSSATNWDGAAGTPWDVTNGPSNTANFNTDSLAAVVSGTVYTNGITFSTAGSLSGGTVNLAGTTPTIAADQNAAISSVLGGGAGLTKAGSGTLVLSGVNNYTGTTAINAGVLQISSAGALPSSGTAVNLTASGAKLTLGTPGQALTWVPGSAVAQGIHGAGYEAAKAIDGNLATRWAAGPNHWIYADLGSPQAVGQFKINWEAARSNSFVLQTSNDASTWTTASATLSSSAANVWETYNLNPGANGRYIRMLSASTVSAGTAGGDSIWEMQAYSPASGAGTYSIGSLTGVAGTTVDLLGLGSTLEVGSDNSDTTYAGSILGGSTDSFLKEGSGTLTWVGSTNYQVAPTVADGTLKIDLTAGGSELTLPGGNVVVQQNGTLNIESGTAAGADTTFFRNGSITGNGTITKTGTGYLGLLFVSTNGVKDFAGLIDVQEGTLANNSSVWATGSGLMDLNVAENAQFDLRTGNLKIDELSGAGLIARSWTGTSTLSVGNNNGTGATFSGTLQNLRPEGSNGGILAFTKTGTGTQTLSGTCTHTGATTVNNGTLNIDGSFDVGSAVTVQTGATLGGSGTIGGAVTVQDGGTLAGTGTMENTVTIASGATLAPAGATAIGTLTTNGTVNLSGNAVMELNKSGATLTSDQIAGIGNLAVSGTLTVTLTDGSDALALNDTFTLFTASGGFSGNFSAPPTMPELPPGLSWDTTNLLEDGTVTVVNFVGTPVFSPPAGGYVGTPVVTITSDSGSTIYYTVDGSPPTTSSPSGASPLAIGSLPANSTGYTVRAFAKKSGQADSPMATAVYNTLDTAQWNQDADGNWSDSNYWLNSVVPDGIGVPVVFTFEQSANSTVTLDSNRSVGSMHFGNPSDITWTLNAINNSVLTLATSAGNPSIEVDANRSATINALVTATQGLSKTGAGTLALSNANTYTGPTMVTGGTLAYTGPTIGTFGTSALQVAGGATAEFRTLGDAPLAAPITGTGTVLASGSGTSVRPSADNSSFTGTFATANSGAIDFVNVSQGWSANASYLLNGSYMRIYGSSVGQTIGIGSLAGTNSSCEISNWGGNAVTTTLSIGSLNTDTEFAGMIRNAYQGSFSPGTMAVTKVGTGKLTLSGTCDYTGATTVTAGTLAVNGTLAAGSTVTVNSTATLGGTGTVNGTADIQAGATIAPGNSAGTLTVGNASLAGTYQCQLDDTVGDSLVVSGTLTVDPAAQIVVSTLGAPTAASYTILTYGALDGTLPAISGDLPEGYAIVDDTDAKQLKLVKTGGYSDWLTNYPDLTDTTPGGDPDNDGIDNLMEYVIGGDPRVSSTGFLPTQAIVGSDLVISFTRNDDSETDTTLIGQWSANLSDWTNVTPVLINENGDNPDDMTVTIPLSNAVGGKLFGRIRVVEQP